MRAASRPVHLGAWSRGELSGIAGTATSLLGAHAGCVWCTCSPSTLRVAVTRPPGAETSGLAVVQSGMIAGVQLESRTVNASKTVLQPSVGRDGGSRVAEPLGKPGTRWMTAFGGRTGRGALADETTIGGRERYEKKTGNANVVVICQGAALACEPRSERPDCVPI